jgi:arginine utilization regulatory protein
MEKSAVKAALYAARGNVTKAAKHLCISRQLFHYKMKKHGFSRLDFVRGPQMT